MVKSVLEMKRGDSSIKDPGRAGVKVAKREDPTVEETDIPAVDPLEEDLVVTVETEIGKDTVAEDPDLLMIEKDILEESIPDQGQDPEKEEPGKQKKDTNE